MKVGLVHVTCPACGENLEVPVRVKEVTLRRGYLSVKYQDNQNVEHDCEGRMS